MSAPLTPEQMIEKLDGAHKAMTDAVQRQWSGRTAIEMSIPARPDHDTDFLVCDPILEVMAAQRAALSQPARTCGTCAHSSERFWRGTESQPYEVTHCPVRDGAWRLDDGCLKGWTPQETETPT